MNECIFVGIRSDSSSEEVFLLISGCHALRVSADLSGVRWKGKNLINLLTIKPMVFFLKKKYDAVHTNELLGGCLNFFKKKLQGHKMQNINLCLLFPGFRGDVPLLMNANV